MLKRRNAELTEAENPLEDSEKKKVQNARSVSWYVITLFFVVAVLIMLSYFVQQRSSYRAIDTITEQHDKFSTQALRNIEDLQNKNFALIDELEEKEERIEALEDELEQTKLDWAAGVKQTEDTLKSDYNELLLKQQATQYMLELEMALEKNDQTTAKDKFALLQPISGRLDESLRAEYERLVQLLGT